MQTIVGKRGRESEGEREHIEVQNVSPSRCADIVSEDRARERLRERRRRVRAKGWCTQYVYKVTIRSQQNVTHRLSGVSWGLYSHRTAMEELT